MGSRMELLPGLWGFRDWVLMKDKRVCEDKKRQSLPHTGNSMCDVMKLQNHMGSEEDTSLLMKWDGWCMGEKRQNSCKGD